MVTSKKAAEPGADSTVKGAVAKPATAKSAPKVKAPAAVRKKSAAPAVPALSAAQRAHYVEVAAFYIAQRRGFAGANPADDWVAAEAEIDRLVSSGHFAH